MRVPRFYVPAPWPPNQLTLLDERAHYLVRVLRRNVGDEVIAFDGEGVSVRTRVKEVRKHEVDLELIDALAREPAHKLKVTLAIALLKGDALETSLQKATELGVASIQLLETARCERKADAGPRLQRQLQHWRGIVIAAAEQSGRSTLPSLKAPIGFAGWVERPNSAGMSRWVFDPEGGPLPLQIPNIEIEAAIGPEGGFTEEELALARRAGAVIVKLGPRVLRADTAPVVALTALQLRSGEWG